MCDGHSGFSVGGVKYGATRGIRCSLKQKRASFLIIVTILLQKKSKLIKWWDLEQKVTIFTKQNRFARTMKVI